MLETVLYGLAIVSAAFLLNWTSEALQVDVSQGLALAIIALIAVLLEYAVDVTFAWKAGNDPQFAPYAIANMTGANRILIGGAWPLIFGLFWLKTRQRVLELERGCSRWGRIGQEELKRDLGLQATEDFKCGWIVAHQYRVEPIGEPHGAAGQMRHESDAITDLLGEQAIWPPGIETAAIGAQQIGQQQSIAAIGMCPTLTVVPARAFDDVGGMTYTWV